MNLWSVEHFFGIFSSKLDSPVIKTLEMIRFSSNQNIGVGESNFDEKNVEEMFNWSEVHSRNTTYKIGTLVGLNSTEFYFHGEIWIHFELLYEICWNFGWNLTNFSKFRSKRKKCM